MTIKYKPQEQELKVGLPYTFGASGDWFMRAGQTNVVFLRSGSTPALPLGVRHATTHIESALTQTGFRYATSMEIK